MKQQGVAFRIESLTAIINTSHLTGSHKYQRTFLIVILTTTVSLFTVYFLFQINAIEAKVLTFMFQNINFRKSMNVTNGLSVSIPKNSL